MLIDVFYFADQDEITHGLGYDLILKRSYNDIDVFKDNGVAAAKM